MRLNQPNTLFLDTVNQLDVSFSKTVRASGLEVRPELSIFNALNANPVTVMNLNYTGTGARWLQPQGILPARLFKLSVQFDY